MNITVTVLVENTVRQRGLLAEHGLAYWIQFGKRRILFDTGQGIVLQHNARELSIDLASVDDVALSHGHYDHAGGLEAVLLANPAVRVFAHPDCTHPRFRQTDQGRVLDVGMIAPNRNALERMEQCQSWIKTNACTEIRSGLLITGPIPRVNDFEDTGGRFYLDAECRQKDAIVDDHALFFDTANGIVVVLGCAHSGVINTLDFVRQQIPDRPLHAVLGGLHLLHASAERVQRTIERLDHWGTPRLAVGHCTGDHVVAELRTAFPDRFMDFCVGSEFKFVTPDRPTD